MSKISEAGQTPGTGPGDRPRSSSRFRAPARVNIIGEHTDYNDGFVLPTTTALYTTVTARPGNDRNVRVTSSNLSDTQQFSLDDIEPQEAPQWIDYVKGVAAEIEAMGIHLPGVTLEVETEIPLGGGLSSSASFELALATALIELAGRSLPMVEVAKLCRRAENRYAGVNCGIMDQFTIACCEHGNAMLLDCRSMDVTQLPIPQGTGLLLTHSGVEHRLPDSGYNNRAEECAEAVRLISRDIPQVTSLRNSNLEMLEAWQDRLGDRLYRRCRHVVSENRRVHDAVAAMKNGDVVELGKLVSESHQSLRDDYEVSCPEVDCLVNIADNVDGVLGSRIVGAGFGGCVLSVVHSDKIDAAARQISEQYAEVVADVPWTHIVRPALPARRVS